MAAVFPVYYGRAPLVDADALSWEDTRPEDDEYWRRVGELQRRDRLNLQKNGLSKMI